MCELISTGFYEVVVPKPSGKFGRANCGRCEANPGINNDIYLLQLGCYPVAVVLLHVNKH